MGTQLQHVPVATTVVDQEITQTMALEEEQQIFEQNLENVLKIHHLNLD